MARNKLHFSCNTMRGNMAIARHVRLLRVYTGTIGHADESPSDELQGTTVCLSARLTDSRTQAAYRFSN